jgi:SLAP domain-containing protein
LILIEDEECAGLSNKDELVFVYGTLRKNESNHRLLSKAECLFEQCWTYGKLYDTGLGYPTMVALQKEQELEDDREAMPKITGELFRVTANELITLDELEGYTGQAATNLYDRIHQPIHTIEGVIEALVYVNASLPITEEQRIASGDWKVYQEMILRIEQKETGNSDQRGEEDSHRLILQETWERALSAKDRETFQELFDMSPHPLYNEILFLPIRAGKNYEGNLFATVLIQNRREEDLLIEDFPLIVQDASSLVAEHRFTIKELVVKANTSTPWTFIFPKDTIKEENIDFSTWSLRTI